MPPSKGGGLRNRDGITKRRDNSSGPGRRNYAHTGGTTSLHAGMEANHGGNGSPGIGKPAEHVSSCSSDKIPKSMEDAEQDSPNASPPTSFTSMLDMVPLEYRAYQNERQLHSIARMWHQQMQLIDFSRNPLWGEERPLMRTVSALLRLKAALTEMPNPFAPEKLTEALGSAGIVVGRSEMYVTKLAEGDWVGAVLQLFQDIGGFNPNDVGVAERQKILYDHWCGSFAGNSLQALQSTIQHYQSNWENAYGWRYSKSINIVQGSGMGKSRLADEMGKRNFQFPFVFRNPGETGYPPGDTEITDYLRQSSSHPSILAAGLYAALGSIGIFDVHSDF